MSDKLLDIEIVSPQQLIYKGKTSSVTVPGSLAPFQILYDHAPIFSTLEIGTVKLLDENNKFEYFAVGTGFVEVSHNSVSIVVEQACSAKDVNLSETQQLIDTIKNELTSATNAQKEILMKKLNYEENKLNIVS